MSLGSTQPLTEMNTKRISWGWRRPLRKADNLPPSCAVVTKSGNLNFLEFETGPVILDDRKTGQNYLDFLQNELPKQLEYVPLTTRIAMYFQHDGAPSHYTRHVMQHLNDAFLNRWIGRGSSINWPPRSPDLTPSDFCLRGLMKSEVYRKKVDTRDELLVNILDVIACIK